MHVDQWRVSAGNSRPIRSDGRCVLLWVQRAQRSEGSLALTHAIERANELRRPVCAVFGLTPGYPGANLRHYQFMLEGLAELGAAMERRGIPFVLRIGSPDEVLLRLAAETEPCLVVADEEVTRVPRGWRERVGRELRIAFERVDADVIVPQAHFPKEEWAARTLRPKLKRLLPEYLVPVPEPELHHPWLSERRLAVPRGEALSDLGALLDRLRVDRSLAPVTDFRGGLSHARSRLDLFLRERLACYPADRNNPALDGTSLLSPYLHFGQIGVQEVALAALHSGAPQPAVDAFLEELIVRRELSVNFVRHNPAYDTLAGCPEWARRTLAAHATDPRPGLYSEAGLEAAETADPLWNAAQREMVRTGRMHGYMRMLWAKRLLEWTHAPEAAYELALRLNDRYFLDGRDPNGYAGVAWAIGGKHDRPWGPERPIFGLVRYMSSAAAYRKFDAPAYIRRWSE